MTIILILKYNVKIFLFPVLYVTGVHTGENV